MVDLEQSHEHSLKDLSELCFFYRVGYFAVSHHTVSEGLILTELKTQVNVQLQNKVSKCRLKRMKCDMAKHCTFLYAFCCFFWLLK